MWPHFNPQVKLLPHARKYSPLFADSWIPIEPQDNIKWVNGDNDKKLFKMIPLVSGN